MQERDRVTGWLLDLAESDPDVVGAAVTGSHALGDADRWSDVDVVFGVDGPLDAVMRRWTGMVYRDLAAVHHWDLPSGSAVYRVFLLPGWLEVDIGFVPRERFGPRGPAWRTVFGRIGEPEAVTPADRGTLVGLAWHHAWHARVCVERGRWWQAEYWVSAARDQVLALACLRMGYPAAYARGAHLLPPGVTGPLEASLVRSLDAAELRRVLGVVVSALGVEVRGADPDLAGRLGPMLTELTTAPPADR